MRTYTAARIGGGAIAGLICAWLAPAQQPQLSESDRAFVEIHFLAAKRAESLRDFATAAGEYRTIIGKFPGQLPQVYHNFGVVLYADRKCDQAAAALEQANRLGPGAAATRLLLGMSYLCLERPGKALPELQAAHRLQPGGETAAQLGLAYTALDLPREAIEHLQSALDASSSREHALYLLGDNYFKLAKQVAEDLIAKNPNSRYDNLVVARIFDRQGFYQVAAKAYLTAVEKDPWNAATLLRLARVLAILGHQAGADLLLERYRVLVPGDRGVRLDEKLPSDGPPAAAGADFVQAVRSLPPVDARRLPPLPLLETAVNQAVEKRLAADRSGKWKLVVRRFAERRLPEAVAVLRTIPATSGTWVRDYLIAAARILNNDLPAAEKAFHPRLRTARAIRAVQLLDWEILEGLAYVYFGRLLSDYPNSSRAHFIRARVLDAQDKKEAIEEYEAAISADPQQPGIRLALAEFLVSASRLEDALAQCQQELELNPNSSAARSRIGRIYVDLRKPEEGMPYLAAALEAAPDDADAHSALGRAYELRGQDEKALASYARALELNPKLNRLHYVLGGLYRRLGKDDLADREFDLFQKAGIAERQDHVESVQRYYGARPQQERGRR